MRGQNAHGRPKLGLPHVRLAMDDHRPPRQRDRCAHPPPTPAITATCTHDGRDHAYLGYNPGTHTHPNADHGPHETGKCAGI